MASVSAEPAEIDGPSVAHQSTCEERLLELLLHGRDIEQFEREALTLTGHQVVVVVEPGSESSAKRIEVEQRFPGHGRSLPNT